MAVQAQYPSNVLLLNNRNGQEGNDYSLQQQQQQQQQQEAGALIDQTHMFFNNGVGGTNLRKRSRESIVGNGVCSTTTVPPINLFSQQSQEQAPQPTTLINLSQLHNQPQPNVCTGLRLAFEEHHHHHHHHHQSLIHPSSSSSSSFLLSDDLSAQMKQQRDEIDLFLQLQGDELRRTLAERRQKQYRTLMSAAEELAARRLKEKEAEVEKAARKSAELEARMAQIRGETQVWQLRARTHDAHVASMQAQLQQAMMVCGGVGAQDQQEEEERVRGGGGGEAAEDAESAHIDRQRVVVSQNGGGVGGPSCKACRVRVASVVLLPCRHLCLCTNCDAAVEACPLCLSYRSASIQVFLS